MLFRENTRTYDGTEVDSFKKIQKTTQNLASLGRQKIVLHPRDWRNIPECVRQCCEVLLSRMDIIESQFKNYKEGFEDRNQIVMGQIGLVKKQCN